ncbi:MAG TPA: acetylxylan esterase [Pirellulaceae bacterium]|nr:acetylxylan esterase [Pirellulaceae bacterium]
MTTLPRNCSIFVLIAAVWSSFAAGGRAEPLRALEPGKLPADVRLEKPKDLDGYFPFAVPKSKEEWTKRAERVRRQMLVSQGLWPMPTKSPLNAVVHGKIDMGDYTVEKVYFESFPGFYVTGSLFKPKKIDGKAPGLLHPHGHWANGRFHDKGLAAVQAEIKAGAEKYEDSGRNHLQARAVGAARLGCIVFQYDMIGYADSQQLPQSLVHGFRTQRPDMNDPKNFGFFSTPAESHLESAMGLQTWNSIRSLDFLLSLPEVDPQRIGISGASGGGTQTFMLAAVDDRVSLAFPAVMVSTAMQGGCTCENACVLRVDTGNIEFAALFAPKPLGLTAADDWTKEMRSKGFPELKAHYTLMGAPDNVFLLDRTEFGHNYNYVSRSAYYTWLNKHFKLGHEEPIVEQDFSRLDVDKLTVWDAEHPKPAGGDDFERKLVKHWHDDAQQQLVAIAPKDKSSLEKWRKVAGGAIDAILGRSLPGKGEVEWDNFKETPQGDAVRFVGVLRNKTRGEELPVLFFLPKNWDRQVVIWLSEKGKNGLVKDDGSPTAEVQRLIDAGVSVCGVDLLFQGESLADGTAVSKTRKVANNREFAGYTFGYNHTLFAQRVHDVLTVVGYVKHDDAHSAEKINLIALDGTGPIAAVALAQCEGAIRKAAIDTHGFRFAGVTDYLDVSFLPGGAKYGDLPGILALAAPTNLSVSGETAESAALAAGAYVAAGAKNSLVLGDKQDAAAAVKFVLGK